MMIMTERKQEHKEGQRKAGTIVNKIPLTTESHA